MNRWQRSACTWLMVPGLCLSSLTQGSDLQTLYREMINTYPGIEASAARVEASKFRAEQAMGGLLPQVNLNGSFNRTGHRSYNTAGNKGPKDYYDGHRYSLTVSQTLFDKAKFENKRGYDFLLAKSQQEHLSMIGAISVDLMNRYVQVLFAEDQLAQVETEKNLAARKLERLHSLYERQLAIITDVLNVETRFNGLQAEEITAQNLVNTSRAALSELIGREITEPLSRFQDRIGYTESAEQTRQYWVDEGIRNNHSLKSLAKQVESARSELKQASAGHLPSVSLQLTAQESNIGFENTSSPKNQSLVASLNLTIPLYSGGSTSARRWEKRASLVESKARYEEERRKTIKQIREAFLNIRANIANIEASKKAISSAERSYEASEKGFQFGTVTVVDVLDAKSAVLRYTNEYRQKQYDYAVNLMNLLRLSGKFSADSIIMANDWLVNE